MVGEYSLEQSMNLNDYKNPDGDPFYENAEFSPRFQTFRLFRTCMTLQFSRQYERSRRTFYDGLAWFETVFDEPFVQRCQNIIDKYSSPAYVELYTYEQIEQIKFMRIVWEFSVMLLDASTHNEVQLNTNPNVETELVPIGYAQIFNFEQMALELFLHLTQIQRQQSQMDAVKFFYHTVPWFGAIFDSKFMSQGYVISEMETNIEQKYRKLVAEFAKLLTRKAIMATPFATLVYKPVPGSDIPHTPDDIFKKKKDVELLSDDSVRDKDVLDAMIAQAQTIPDSLSSKLTVKLNDVIQQQVQQLKFIGDDSDERSNSEGFEDQEDEEEEERDDEEANGEEGFNDRGDNSSRIDISKPYPDSVHKSEAKPIITKPVITKPVMTKPVSKPKPVSSGKSDTDKLAEILKNRSATKSTAMKKPQKKVVTKYK